MRKVFLSLLLSCCALGGVCLTPTQANAAILRRLTYPQYNYSYYYYPTPIYQGWSYAPGYYSYYYSPDYFSSYYSAPGYASYIYYPGAYSYSSPGYYGYYPVYNTFYWGY
jgi:hypothetical protein